MLATRDWLPAWATLRPLNVRTPSPAEGCDVVPLRGAPLKRLSVTVLLLIGLPNRSVTWTVTLDGNVTPAKIEDGASWVIWMMLGAVGTTVNAAGGELERVVAAADAVRL